MPKKLTSITQTRVPGKPSSRRKLMADFGGESLPLYKKMKLEITRTLSSGELDPRVALPTEEELSARYGISVGTVRRAMSELVAEKVVVRQQGRGTFLTPLNSERMANVFWHVARKDGSREAPIVQNLSFVRATADAATAERLVINTGEPIFHIGNLMIMGGNPVVVDDIRIPQALFVGLTKSEFVARETSIYGFYQSRFRINVIKAVDHINAVSADAYTARMLDVAVGTPLLEIRRITYTFNNVPIECRRWLLRTGDYNYMNVTGGAGTTY